MNSAAFNQLRFCEVKTYADKDKAHGASSGISRVADIVQSLLVAKSFQDIHTQCLLICESYGFDFFTVIEYVVRPNSPPLLYRMLQHVDSFVAHYEKHALIFDDPCIKIATQSILPYVIPEDLRGYTFTPNELNVIHTALDFGLRQVFNAPFHNHVGGWGLVRFFHRENGRTSIKEPGNLFTVHAELFLLSSYIHASLTQLLRSGEPSEVLSEREKHVLQWIAAGASAARVGDFLMISENTVNNHLKNIRIKLGAKNTPHAVAKALMERVITM